MKDETKAKEHKKEEKEEEKKELETHKQLEKLEEENKTLQQQTKEFETQYKRALADYQNLQKRVNEEKGNWARLSNRELILRLLPVLDTLILANQHDKNTSIMVSINHFLDVLKAEGVTRIETIGKEFDPEHMEALGTEDGEEGKVIKEVRAGYMMYDTLLRPAQVLVGKTS